MIGRAAYERPWLFAEADRRFYGEQSEPPTRREVVEAMVPYVERWHRQGSPVRRITRHLVHLFAGKPGARFWRRSLSENAAGGPEIVRQAMAGVPASVLDERVEIGVNLLQAV